MQGPEGLRFRARQSALLYDKPSVCSRSEFSSDPSFGRVMERDPGGRQILPAAGRCGDFSRAFKRHGESPVAYRERSRGILYA